MGRTVKVEGQIAATTTSSHIARTVGPDMRLKGNQPVERKNWIETDHLSKDRTTNTKFDGGWVWKSDTLCGEPPATHDMPADSLPGVLNGGVVNSYAEAQPGQGAQTVYVEGQKVIRYDDKTFQNKRNSKGKIINAEELAAYLAEPLKPDAPPPKPKPVVATTKTAPTAGNQGTATPDGGKTGAGRGATQGTDPTKDCSIISVSMNGNRVQQGDVKSQQPGWIWVLDSTTLVVTVVGEKCCDKHPLVTFGDDKPQKGLTTSWNPSNVFRFAERAALNLLVPGSGNLPPRPVQTQLTVQSCKTQFNRSVMVMGRQNVAISIGGNGFDGSALLKKIPLIGKKIDEAKFFEGSVEFALAWKEEDSWPGALTLTVTGQLCIISLDFEGWTVNLWDVVPGGQLLTAVTEIAASLGVEIVCGLVIGFSVSFTFKADLSLKLLYGREPAFAKGALAGEAQAAIKVGLRIKGGDLLDAFGGVEGSVTLSAEWKGKGWPQVKIETFIQGALKAKLEAKIGLGWLSVKSKCEYPIWESPKVALKELSFFDAQAAIPSGGKP